jgi:1,4-alpha-glucan branching enzyme
MSVQATEPKTALDDPLTRLAEALHHDPFQVLGPHPDNEEVLVRVFRPGAKKVSLPDLGLELPRRPTTDFFEASVPTGTLPERYRIAWEDYDGSSHEGYDPYCFPPTLGDLDLYLFGQGRHWHVYRQLGAHPYEMEGIHGVRFAVWAPNAKRVSRIHAMRSRGSSGVWELFIPGLEPGALYKYELRGGDGRLFIKGDPYANAWQRRPDTACVVAGDSQHQWQDQAWMNQRREWEWQHRPMAVYELHLGSWQREDGGFLDYRQLADRLVPYLQQMGFSHVELLPVTEHPLDASWGYQCTGYYAPTSRFGTPDDFRYFVDSLHRAGIGVLLDWVPGHFPKDEHGLSRFDGTALYEYEDTRKGEHREWGTLIFNYGRNEVKNFLLASAVYWLEEFHIDGLRVDAVASMLYLDYSRNHGEWEPNQYGGREHLEAVAFLHEMNEVVHEQYPGALTIAEESTAWPQVSRPVWLGGLGFSMKWNMGWMHDTLSYMSQDPIYRHYHHDLLTFGLLYCFTENFVLPFSHDEVVHGKAAMLSKMPGDDRQQFANLRLLYTMQWTYPGKKLLFMGSELATRDEWNENVQLDWSLLLHDSHRGVQRLLADLNRLYREDSALYALDFSQDGFEWIDCHDASQSVLSYLRLDQAGNGTVVILNFTPVTRKDYRIGLPEGGWWQEVLNSDAECYWGSNVGNGGGVQAEATSWMNRPYSASLTLPPLGALVLRPAR